MAVLLTGGTGKTSLRIARFLQDAEIPFLLASRKAGAGAGAPNGMPALNFNYLDSSTFENPFQHKFPYGKKISAIYLIAPATRDPSPPMMEFVDLAFKKHGVKRFVLMAGGYAQKGGSFVGKVWEQLDDMGAEYCVLRSSWFMENFFEAQPATSIKEESKIYTACGNGKIPFISTIDIAALAFRALTDEKTHNTAYDLQGPEQLTYDDIAAKFSTALGRSIEHVKLSEEEKVQRNVSLGLPEHLAKLLTTLEVRARNGVESKKMSDVEKVTGRPPMKFDVWVRENRAAWL